MPTPTFRTLYERFLRLASESISAEMAAVELVRPCAEAGRLYAEAALKGQPGFDSSLVPEFRLPPGASFDHTPTGQYRALDMARYMLWMDAVYNLRSEDPALIPHKTVVEMGEWDDWELSYKSKKVPRPHDWEDWRHAAENFAAACAYFADRLSADEQGEPTSSPGAQPKGWTKAEICTRASISETQFVRLRNRAGLPTAPLGGKGKRFTYSPEHIERLIEELESRKHHYQERDKMIRALRQMLAD